MNRIVGLTGLAGSGKNSVANILVKNYHNWKIVSSGSAVKDVCAVMFDWPRNLLEGDTVESRQWRETTDSYWTEKLGYNFTPRIAMQWLATDIVRKQLSENFWINKTEKTIRNIIENTDYNVVITDVRFKNEIDLIRKLHGEIWQVELGERPKWFDIAADYNKGGCKGNIPSELKNIHNSEWDWIGYTVPDKNIHMAYKSLEMLEQFILKGGFIHGK